MNVLSKSLNRLKFSAFCILLLGGILATWHANAEEVPPYPELLRRSLSQAPLLLEQAANVRSASADIEQAQAYRNPNFSGTIENLNTRADLVQHTGMLNQPFEIGGKRAARIEARTKDLLVAEAREKQIQVQYAAELASNYGLVEAMKSRVKVAEEDMSRATDDLGAAKALVEAGKEAQLRLSQAQANVSAAEAVLQSARANLTEAFERLSAFSGSRKSFTDLSTNLTEQVIQLAPGALGDISSSPFILRAQAEREAYLAQVRVEEKKWIPDVSLSAGIRRFEGSSDNALVIGFSSDIPIFDQNRGGIASAKEKAIAAEARLNAIILDTGAAQRSALAQVTASERRLIAARSGEQAADQAYLLAKTGYEAGKTSLIELLLTRKSLTDAKLMTIDASFTLVKSLASLAVAEGRIAFGDLK